MVDDENAKNDAKTLESHEINSAGKIARKTPANEDTMPVSIAEYALLKKMEVQ